MTDIDKRFQTCLRDMLYNFHPTSGASDAYCKGMFNGVVGTLMACNNLTFQQALQIAVANMPFDSRALNDRNVPECWLIDIVCLFKEVRNG